MSFSLKGAHVVVIRKKLLVYSLMCLYSSSLLLKRMLCDTVSTVGSSNLNGLFICNLDKAPTK